MDSLVTRNINNKYKTSIKTVAILDIYNLFTKQLHSLYCLVQIHTSFIFPDVQIRYFIKLDFSATGCLCCSLTARMEAVAATGCLCCS